MTKYIIELDDDIKYLIINGKADNRCYTLVRPVAELEILNSDYINENFGELQDEAYDRGYKDGKNIIDMGCEGCKYTVRFADDEPCKSCSNCYKNQYEPAPQEDDRIEVGDEVTTHWAKGIATVADYGNDIFYVMFSDGSCGKREVNMLKKTGRHFDIQKVLEEMKND